MDKVSVKVLRMIRKASKPISRDEVEQKFGESGVQSLRQLQSDKFISQGTKHGGVAMNQATGRLEPAKIPNGLYSIEPKGRLYLEQKFWNDFDRLVTRLTALVGFFSGITALIMHFI